MALCLSLAIPRAHAAGDCGRRCTGGKPPISGQSLPEVHVAATVSPGGEVRLTVSCPAVDGSCEATVVLRTLHPLSSRAAFRPAGSTERKRPLTIGHASFALPGGATRVLSIRLSGKGLAELRKARRLTIVATLTSNVDGVSQAVTETVTLRPPAKTRG
ncbi:MAG TPA: hypothetical protein VGX16_07600 [Solirubrobacteraceae bacterium]|nr:hypothetical protein [Solirubrobacteraceae bacterium]